MKKAVISIILPKFMKLTHDEGLLSISALYYLKMLKHSVKNLILAYFN